MITLFVSLFFIMIFNFMKSFSPVKMIMIFLFFSGSLFLMCMGVTGELWLLTTLYLLIVGGIIVSLMVLSSVQLNQKIMFKLSKNIKMLATLAVLVTIGVSVSPILDSHPSSSSLLKWVFHDSYFMYFLTFVLLCYFSSFILIIKKHKFSLRKNMC